MSLWFSFDEKKFTAEKYGGQCTYDYKGSFLSGYVLTVIQRY